MEKQTKCWKQNHGTFDLPLIYMNYVQLTVISKDNLKHTLLFQPQISIFAKRVVFFFFFYKVENLQFLEKLNKLPRHLYHKIYRPSGSGQL